MLPFAPVLVWPNGHSISITWGIVRIAEPGLHLSLTRIEPTCSQDPRVMHAYVNSETHCSKVEGRAQNLGTTWYRLKAIAPVIPGAENQLEAAGLGQHRSTLPLLPAIVRSGCSNQMPYTEWLKRQIMLSHSSGGWILTTRCRQVWCLLGIPA